MKYKPANNIQYVQFFGEFGVVSPVVGLIRFLVGLDQNISRTYEGIKKYPKEFKLI